MIALLPQIPKKGDILKDPARCGWVPKEKKKDLQIEPQPQVGVKESTSAITTHESTISGKRVSTTFRPWVHWHL